MRNFGDKLLSINRSALEKFYKKVYVIEKSNLCDSCSLGGDIAFLVIDEKELNIKLREFFSALKTCDVKDLIEGKYTFLKLGYMSIGDFILDVEELDLLEYYQFGEFGRNN